MIPRFNITSFVAFKESRLPPASRAGLDMARATMKCLLGPDRLRILVSFAHVSQVVKAVGVSPPLTRGRGSWGAGWAQARGGE